MPWRRWLNEQAKADVEKAARAQEIIEDLRRLSGTLVALTDELAEVNEMRDSDD